MCVQTTVLWRESTSSTKRGVKPAAGPSAWSPTAAAALHCWLLLYGGPSAVYKSLFGSSPGHGFPDIWGRLFYYLKGTVTFLLSITPHEERYDDIQSLCD
jgi:hypothetical protein